MIVNPKMPGGNVIFCDDIRHELNGKMTLVGVYGHDIRLFGDAPNVISNLSIVVDFRVDPKDCPFDGIIKVVKSDTNAILAEQEIQFSKLTEANVDSLETAEPEAQEYLSIVAYFSLRNILIEEPCRLKVRVFSGENEIRIGSLYVGFAPISEMQTPF